MRSMVHTTVGITFVFFLTGCSTVPKTPANVSHSHAVPYIVSLGEAHFHAAMEYSPSDGEIVIRFFDESEHPYRAFMAVKAKAELILPGQEPKEFYLKNSRAGLTPSHAPGGSYRYVNNAYTTHIEASERWMKDLSAFELKVWLPVKGNVYEATFKFPERS